MGDPDHCALLSAYASGITQAQPSRQTFDIADGANRVDTDAERTPLGPPLPVTPPFDGQ